MPTYEYRCPDGHEFEQFFRSIREGKAELECPVCGKLAQRKVSGGAGLVFKGSGFYITDYGKDGKKDQRKTTGGEGSSSSEKASGTSSESTSGGESKSSGDKKTNKGSSSPE